MPSYKDIVPGMKFGRLTVIELHEIKEYGNFNKRFIFLCKCECGKTSTPDHRSLLTGGTVSCGCHRSEIFVKRNTTHGLTHCKLMKVWIGLRQRITNPNSRRFDSYGGRGINVCDEWSDFAVFSKWAIENGYAEGLSIDRIDNNGDYCPNNCRWTTDYVQSRNTRRNINYTINGVTKCLRDWIEDPLCIHKNYKAIWYRIQRGWDIERALTTPNNENIWSSRK